MTGESGCGERREETHIEREMRVEDERGDEREKERGETSVTFSTLASIVLALGECM